MKSSKPKSTESSRSWFCVLNIHSLYDMNDSGKTEKQLKLSGKIRELFSGLAPEEIVDRAIEMWCHDKPYRTCAINYEMGDNGNEHLHMVLEDPAKARFSAIQKLYPGIHIEPTRGSKEQAEDYINKVGRFEEKGHTVIVPARYKGDIKARQGKRNDLSVIEELIEQGKTPNEIMDISISYRQYEKLIRGCFFSKRMKETPPKREVDVTWHTGESGAGKSYTYVNLCRQFTEENVYLLSDYRIGGFDLYCGEPILFMDEFKGDLPFQQLLHYLDGYRIQIHCRYANAHALWREVHIASIYPPDEIYKVMVDSERRERDHIIQLMRRISKIVYHYTEANEFKTVEIDAAEYRDYDSLKALAKETYTQLSLLDNNLNK